MKIILNKQFYYMIKNKLTYLKHGLFNHQNKMIGYRYKAKAKGFWLQQKKL